MRDRREQAVSKMTVLRLIRDGVITGKQVCKSAPWAILEAQITALTPAMIPTGRPRTSGPAQKMLDLQ